MGTYVIELNDAGIAVYGSDQLVSESPGYAILDSGSLLVGEEAYLKARLNPRRTNHVFWEQLSVDPLPQSIPGVRHHADIAYAHLVHIWEQIKAEADEIILAVPGSFETQQLGIMLGIAKECDLPVVGLVDSALAASSGAAASSAPLLHLDVQLHRVVLTRLDRDARLKRIGLKQLPKTGLVSLRETWADAITDTFVRLTRFDPMHRAETEQQLYNALPGWFARLQNADSIAIELNAGGRTHRVTLTRERLSQAVAETYEQILQLVRGSLGYGESASLQVSHRLHDLPGFDDALAELGDCEIIHLPSDAVPQGAFSYRSHICLPHESLRCVTHVPWQHTQPMVTAPETEGGRKPGRPTHLVYRARAYQIDEIPLMVGAAIPAGAPGINLTGLLNGVSRAHCSIYVRGGQVLLDDRSTYGTFVNEEKVEGTVTLQIGDKIRIGTPGEELQLIALVKPYDT